MNNTTSAPERLSCIRFVRLSVLDFIAVIRRSRQDSERFFMRGGCWEMFCLLRNVWPEAQPYHSWTDDVTLGVGQHVATKIGDHLYDIRGRIRRPSLYQPMTLTSWPSLRGGDRPHRWAKHYRSEPNAEVRHGAKDADLD
jgi:hypothetical protein